MHVQFIPVIKKCLVIKKFTVLCIPVYILSYIYMYLMFQYTLHEPISHTDLRWHTLAIGICDDIGFPNDRKSHPVAHSSTQGIVYCHGKLREKAQNKRKCNVVI